MNVKSKAGFSLVELMVVVAIIGILATVAIPNFTKFQARAKQSSAKAELTGIYTAQRGFATEYQTFHPNLPYIGFMPEGFPIASATGCPVDTSSAGSARAQRLYVTGFGSATTVAVTFQPIGAPPVACTTGGHLSVAYDSNVPGGPTVAAFPNATALTGGTAPDVTADTFKAASLGKLSTRNSSNSTWDAWTMNQDKVLLNSYSGL